MGFECMVENGSMNYDFALGKLRAHRPRLVAEFEWAEAKEKMSEQRNRNMRLNGIH
jgi:hypothetical protein